MKFYVGMEINVGKKHPILALRKVTALSKNDAIDIALRLETEAQAKVSREYVAIEAVSACWIHAPKAEQLEILTISRRGPQ